MPEEKFTITKGSAQETLLIPLFARKIFNDLYPGVIDAVNQDEILSRVETNVTEIFPDRKFFTRMGAYETAMRTLYTKYEMEKYLQQYPEALVVNMGCGLDETYRLADNGKCRTVCIDFPDVIEVRKHLIPENDRLKYIACDLTNHSWMDMLDYEPEKGIFCYALGVFYYIQMDELRKMFDAMAKRFPDGRLCFDATNKRGLKMILKDVLAKNNMEAGAYFYLQKPVQDLMSWSDAFDNVAWHGIFGGYGGVDKRYGLAMKIVGFFGDRLKMAQYDVITFRK